MAAIFRLLAAAFLFAAVACDDDEGSQALPTSTPAAASSTARPDPSPGSTVTPTVTVQQCPLGRAACDLSSTLQRALAAGSVEAIPAVVDKETFLCPGGTPQGAGGPFPLCNGAAQGEMRVGVRVARRLSGGAVISVPAYEELLRAFRQAVNAGASDEQGTGSLKLEAHSCLDPGMQPSSCNRFTVIFSAILGSNCCPPLGAGPGRELLIFFGEMVGNTAIVESTWTGIVQPQEAPIIFRQGGIVPDLGRVTSMN